MEALIIEPKFKDGDGGGELDIYDTVTIEYVNKGYIVIWSRGDEIVKEVYSDKDLLMTELLECL